MGYPIEMEGLIAAITYPGVGSKLNVVVDFVTSQGPFKLVFLGRRRIECLEVGLRLRLRGNPVVRDGFPTIYNPSYTVLPSS